MRITYPDVHNLSASANPTRVARKLQADQGLRASWWRSGGACGADGERAGRASEIRQALWQPEIWGATPNLAASPRKAER